MTKDGSVPVYTAEPCRYNPSYSTTGAGDPHAEGKELQLLRRSRPRYVIQLCSGDGVGDRSISKC